MFVPASIVNMAAAQIALRHGFGGPNTCPVTACAASADAIGWGYRLVRDGYADACLVGGAEACVEGAVIAGFANMGAPSATTRPPPLPAHSTASATASCCRRARPP
jgi:3-oxoacyl-[acyl-carrier-protein] synthase II